MAGIDDTKIKMIQLECIIASKDKEISLLREQLSQDLEVGSRGIHASSLM
jgi:hypothetical protein